MEREIWTDKIPAEISHEMDSEPGHLLGPCAPSFN